MFEQDSRLSFALGALTRRRNVDVIGMRGSGRTHFLERLADKISEDGWRSVWVRGTPTLAGIPFGALQASGVLGTASASGRPPLAVTVNTLLDVTASGDVAFFADDWEYLDEPTRGALAAVHFRSGAPVVSGRRLGTRRDQDSRRGFITGIPHGFTVHMEPFPFERFKQAVEERLGGPVDLTTLTGLFAKSGGLIGVALDILEAGLLNQTLVRQGAVWTARQDLWSLALSTLTEAYLDPLDPHERDATALVAIAGDCDAAILREIVDWNVLESLESASILKTYQSENRQIVTIFPPTLADYLRSKPLPLQRVRLTGLIQDGLGTEPVAHRTQIGAVPEAGKYDMALFTRLVGDRARTRVQVAKAEWSRNPTAAAAVEFIGALTALGGHEQLIDDVIDASIPASTDFASEAELLCLSAERVALREGRVSSALSMLSRAPKAWGTYRRIVDARAVTLSCAFDRLPPDFADTLELTSGLPADVELALLRARIFVELVRGRFSAALWAFDRVNHLSQHQPGHLPDAMRGIALLCLGDARSALDFALAGLDRAYDALDRESARTHAAVLAFLYEQDGRSDEAKRVVGIMHAVGPPPVWHTSLSTQTMADVTSGLISVRNSNEQGAEASLRALDENPTSMGPLPQQNRVLLDAQLLIRDGKASQGADLLWETGIDQLHRGFVFTGVFSLFASLEVELTPERLAHAKTCADQLEGDYITSLIDYFEFALAKDAGALGELPTRLVSAGHGGHALAAYDLAIRWTRESDDSEQENNLQTRRSNLRAILPGARYDVTRFHTQRPPLTDRELEVVQLISDGLSNRQIADLLMLSVRTVETHLRRIMKKTNRTSRQQVIDYVKSLSSD